MRYRDLTERQSDVLAQVYTGNSLPQCRPEVLDALVAKGLIVRISDRIMGRDRFGVITIPQYDVVLSEHVRWCEWAAGKIPATTRKIPWEAQ